MERYFSTKPLFLTPTTLLVIENGLGGAKLVVSRVGGEYLHTIRSFGLPDKAGHTEISHNTVRGSAPADPDPYGPYARPFALDDDSRVFYIDQHISSAFIRGGRQRYVSIVAPVHHLLSLHGDYYPYHGGTPRFPPWGGSSTLTEVRTRPPKCIAVSGSRVIDLDSGSLLRVTDYRRGGSRWEPQTPACDEKQLGREFLRPRDVTPNWLDQRCLTIPAVRTSCTLSECSGPRVRLMMDEEHILILKVLQHHTTLAFPLLTLLVFQVDEASGHPDILRATVLTM